MSSLHRGHANLLCIIPILVYVLLKRALEEIFNPSNSIFVHLFLCIAHLRRSSYPSLLFLELCIHLGISFPFSLPLCFPFSAIMFVKPLQTTLCLLAFLFLWDCFGHCLLYSVPNFHPWFFRHSVYQI